MWCCGTDVLGSNGKYRKSVFDQKEVDSLKRKFHYVSGNQQYITRETFKKNIGYLGIRAVSSFLDRIFNSFDIDEDNRISLADFIEYMQILKDGTDDKKAQISFNLIYMDLKEMQVKRSRKNSNQKNSEHNIQFKTDISKEKKKKVIDIMMFERFFQDFYKSWSNMTNESIPKQTKVALKQFINELFKKVEADGRKAIDIDYYKMLYKDREFMMAFRQINSKLGNFFIKSTNNDYQKNVTLFHKILKKIITLTEKTFPILNRKFIEDLEKPKSKPSNESPSLLRRNEHQNSDLNDENFQKYFYDAKRYEFDNIFEQKENLKSDVQDQTRINTKSDTKSFNRQNQRTLNNLEFFQRIKQTIQKQQNRIDQPLQNRKNMYQYKLEDHVVFLERKLLYLENALKQIIEETKPIYNEMHQEFIKIFERIQRQQFKKQSQMQQFSTQRGHNSNNSPNQHRKQKNQNKKQDVERRNSPKKRRDDKKVFFGDKNFNLVLQIMVGIQMSVRSVSGFQEIIFEEPEDFNLKHTFEMDYGHFGQDDILYTFTDYAPNVFNHIRKIYGIGNEDYINSIGPNKMMSSLIMGKMASFEQLVSEGKSGSFFYHTEDGKYLIKTISQREFYFMRKILEQYFKHIKLNPQTLMPRMFGLHKITETIKKNFRKDNKKTFYLIVMNNFFNTKDKIIDKYDLKGSWIGRQNTSGNGVKKDLNFIKDKRSVDIEFDQKIKLYQIIQKDAQFFANNQIIDYSLLLGFIKSEQSKKTTKIPRTHSLFKFWNEEGSPQNRQKKTNPDILQQKKSMNFRFRSEKIASQSYLFGIIDILTQYNSIKQAEHIFKSCIYDSKGISAIPPEQYKNRFLEFIKYEVFRLGVKSNSKQKSNEKDDMKRKFLRFENQRSISKSRLKRASRSQNQEMDEIYMSDNLRYRLRKGNQNP